jgi:hypothetical protein
MSENDNSEDIKQDPHDSNVTPEPAPDDSTGVKAENRDAHNETRGENMSEGEIASAIRKVEWPMIILTAIIAIATAANVIVYWCESESSSKQTQKLIDTAKIQANAAGDQADAAQQFSDTAEDINGRMSDAVDQLTAAAENAKTSIKATQDALQLEQRAWVFISAMQLKPLVLNDPFTVEYLIKNEGKTPATPRKEGRIFMWISPGRPAGRLDDVAPTPEHRVGVIFPETVYGPSPISSTDNGGQRVVQAGDIASYNAKPPTLWIYIYGRLVYTDAFGKGHTTSFCAVSNGTDLFGACPEGVWPTYAK